MSTSTTNLDLVKPDSNELYDIGVFNGNADKIDAFAGGLATVASTGAYSDLSGKPTIPIVDAALDGESTNAVQNAAVVAGLGDTATAAQKRGTQINATSTNHVSVHSLAVGRHYVGASAAAYIDDLPSSLSSGGLEITVEEMALTNRLVVTVLVNNNNEVGNIYRQWCTQSGWSSWFRYSGEAVT